ncbi:hypothetical protein TNCT_76741 [Trichonephila clavata]|uniref:Uncharacterized protein n=1 Tax=Trichonephila clavata TaxID=2740835 RepID=A0A8X6F5J0_TRICU|nr:hypothetical protein TNCT_76741 [Trichonephila clavata]
MAETYIQPPKFISNTEEYPALPGSSHKKIITKNLNQKIKPRLAKMTSSLRRSSLKSLKLTIALQPALLPKINSLLWLELKQPTWAKHPCQWPTRSPPHMAPISNKLQLTTTGLTTYLLPLNKQVDWGIHQNNSRKHG